MLKREKLDWFQEETVLQTIPFDNITPDKKYNWINLADNDFDSLIPIASKETKAGKSNEAIFNLFSMGVATNRDEWVYDVNRSNLITKMQFLISFYHQSLENNDFSYQPIIKWSETLKNNFANRKELSLAENKAITALYKPFIKKYFYAEKS